MSASAYLEDASGLKGGHAERVIVPPMNDEVVAAALREASAAGIPVTVSGAGTGVAGGRVPFGGWVLSLEKFTRLEIHRGLRRGRRRRAAARRACRRAARRDNSIRPIPPRPALPSAATSPAMPAGRGVSATAPPAPGWSACAWCWPTGACSMSGAASRSISTPARSRCPPSPRTPPAICCVPAWTGSICSSARKARWVWSREATLRLQAGAQGSARGPGLLSQRR